MNDKKFINIFLYHLLDIDQLPPSFESEFLLSLKNDYDPEERTAIISALRWADSHPQFDLQAHMQGVRLTNENIQKIIGSILKSIEKDRYEDTE